MDVLVGGVRLYYEVHGEGDPVLLIHGFPLSGRMWDGVVAALRDRCRLVVPDLRGHGRSAVTEQADMARYAEDLIAVLDAAGERGPVVVAGMSMGGYVALELCRRHSRRVRALALIDTRAAPDTPEVAQGRRETADRVLVEGSDIVATAMVDRLFAPEASPELRSEWLRRMQATTPMGVAAALRAMAERPDSRPTLTSLDLPVLVVVGEEDAITPPEEARRMAVSAQRGRFVAVSGGGHMAPVEQPREVADALRDFLDRLA